MYIRKKDKVIVITGKDRGKEGEVLAVMDNRVVVSGVNMQTHFIKSKKEGEKGKIDKKEGAIDASNVQLIDLKTKKGTRVRFKKDGKNKLRISVKSGDIIKPQ